jgi:hypothetical protein
MTQEPVSTPDVKIYRPAPGSLGVIRNRIIKRQGLMYLLALALFVGYGIFFSNAQLNSMVFTIPILITAGGAGLLISYRQQKKIWDTVEILLGNDFVGRRQLGILEVRIPGTEITKIQDSEIGLLIYTASRERSLIVPAELAPKDFQEIRRALSRWTPVDPNMTGPGWMNVGLGVVLLAAYGVLGFPVTESAPVVLIAFIAAIGINGYFLQRIHHTQGVDPRQKLIFAVSMVLVLLLGLIKLSVVFGV